MSLTIIKKNSKTAYQCIAIWITYTCNVTICESIKSRWMRIKIDKKSSWFGVNIGKKGHKNWFQIKIICTGIVNHLFFHVGAIMDSQYCLHIQPESVVCLYMKWYKVCFYRVMGFLTLNVLLYIVQIQGLGRFLFHQYHVQQWNIQLFIFVIFSKITFIINVC